MILVQCEKDDNSINEYLTATIDGKEFIADWKTADFSEPFYEDKMVVQIKASNYNPAKPITNPNYQSLSLNLLNDSLIPGTYKYGYDFLESPIDKFTLLAYNFYVKDSIVSGLKTVDGFILIDKINYKEGGIIKGEFEFEATDLIDTIWIRNGKFQLKLTN